MVYFWHLPMSKNDDEYMKTVLDKCENNAHEYIRSWLAGWLG